MNVNMYKVIEHCVTEGTLYGISRAYKYEDNPSKDKIAQEVQNYIMLELSEWIEL